MTTTPADPSPTDELTPTGLRIRVLLLQRPPHAAAPATQGVYRVVFEFRDQPSESPTDDYAVLRRQFLRFNVDDGDAIATAYRRLGLRSLSVGDIVAIEDRHYRCEPTTWTAVPQPALTTAAHPDSPGSR